MTNDGPHGDLKHRSAPRHRAASRTNPMPYGERHEGMGTPKFIVAVRPQRATVKPIDS
jgi:hypothetical protein